jgi:hypothetical protein
VIGPQAGAPVAPFLSSSQVEVRTVEDGRGREHAPVGTNEGADEVGMSEALRPPHDAARRSVETPGLHILERLSGIKRYVQDRIAIAGKGEPCLLKILRGIGDRAHGPGLSAIGSTKLHQQLGNRLQVAGLGSEHHDAPV